MGLFNSTCCPPKPRRTIDYILNWIDKYGPIITKDTSYINDLLDWRRTVESDLEGYVKNAADEYITNYDWSQVPELDAKADKVKNAVLGHLASIDANGNLQDSGKKPVDFALEGHVHSAITDESTESSISIDEGIITINIEGEGSGGETEINGDNIGNLNRALATPSSVPENDDTKLITSKAVYVALQGKAGSVHTHNGIEDVDEGIQYAKVYADNQTQGDPNVIIELNDSNTPGSSVTKHATISIDNIDNLNRALATPSSIPEDDATKLITSKAVYDALETKAEQEHTHLISDIQDLEGTIASLTARIRALEDSPVTETISLTGAYEGYNTLLNENSQDILYLPTSTSRKVLYKVDNLYDIAEVGSLVTLSYVDSNNNPQTFSTNVSRKTTSPYRLELEDAVPDVQYVNCTNITLTLTK